MKRADWIVALRSMIGGEFLHQGRRPDMVDCIGLLVIAARKCGEDTSEYDNLIKGYKRVPDPEMFNQMCERFMTRKDIIRGGLLREQITPGDVLVFYGHDADMPQHVAVYTEDDPKRGTMMVHSEVSVGVHETMLRNSFWMNRLHSVWVPNALED